MIVNQIETELAVISQQLRSITVEIDGRKCRRSVGIFHLSSNGDSRVDNHRSGGSGVIWSADGLIVTNSHVVRGSKVDVKLENERVVKGSVIARDNQQDLALIKVEAEKLPIPNIGNSQLLRPGEIVLAMGSPWGFRGALAAGVIHTTEWHEASKTKLNGIRQTSLNQTPSTSAIVADIRLAPGNSGGVLANVLGEVIGINTAIYRGLALAIPSHQVADFIKSIP